MGVLAIASLIGVAIFAAWAIPANLATDGRIATDGIVREHIFRALAAMEGHGTPLLLAPLYYPAVAVIGFAPWTRHLSAGVRRLVSGQSWRSLPNVFLLAWIAVPAIVFTVAATKLPHYILPIWPALALLVAAAVADDEHDVPSRAMLPATVQRTAIAVVIVVAILGFGLAPIVERLKPVASVAESLQHAPADGPLFVYEFDEPSLVFYAGRRIMPLADEPRWSTGRGRPARRCSPRRVRPSTVEREHGPLGLREIAARRGWNYVKGNRLELVAFVRASDR